MPAGRDMSLLCIVPKSGDKQSAQDKVRARVTATDRRGDFSANEVAEFIMQPLCLGAHFNPDVVDVGIVISGSLDEASTTV
jgi:hypothetical protein